MRHEYVGDVGDFAKFVLLRHLARTCAFELGVIWCVTGGPNRSKGDGKHRGYRQYSGKRSIRSCDEPLFEGFSKFDDESNRRIGNLHEFLPNAKFFDLEVRLPRQDWISAAQSRTKTCEVIFFDPDNGINFDKHPDHCSSKHISVFEMAEFWSKGKSLVVYHHLSRQGSHQSQIEAMKRKLQNRFRDATIYSIHIRRGTARVFFVIVRAEHRNGLKIDPDTCPWKPLLTPDSAKMTLTA